MQKEIENKCTLCGLRVEFSQNTITENSSTEDFFTTLQKLQSSGCVPKGWSRNINICIGSTSPNELSEICSINSSSWRRNRKKCKYWQPDIGLTLGEYLSLHKAQKIEVLTQDIHKLTALATLISIGYLITKLTLAG